MAEVAERNWDEWLRRNQYHMHHHPGPRPHDNDPAVLERTLSERRAKLREREDEAKQDEKEVERLMKVLDRVAKYLRDVTLYEADVVVCTLSTAGGELSSLLDALDLNPEGLEGVGELHHPDDPLRPPPDGSLSDNATRHGKIDTNQHSTHEPTPRRTCSRRTNPDTLTYIYIPSHLEPLPPYPVTRNPYSLHFFLPNPLPLIPTPTSRTNNLPFSVG